MNNSGKDDYSQGVIKLAEARGLAKPGDSTAPAGVDSSIGTLSGESGRAPPTVMIMDRLREKGMLVPDSTLGPEIRSEYRRVKRPLLSNAFGKSASLVDQGNLIMVTSAVPGEGKTYTAVDLALAFAHERDHTVLLVDCDVTKQGMSRLLGVERRFHRPAGQR